MKQAFENIRSRIASIKLWKTGHENFVTVVVAAIMFSIGTIYGRFFMGRKTDDGNTKEN